jgi:glycosyltransferase involved in cell wall biosynthesis
MALPVISIIIPTYNRANLLMNISVTSVLKQSFQDWELLIIDDGSTDNTKKLVLRLIENNHEKNISYYYQENKGQGAARNLGIRKAKGEYILCLDSDDYLLPDMIDNLLNKYNKNDYFIACKNWVYQKNKGFTNVTNETPSSIIFKKSSFHKLGFFDESHAIRGVEDRDLMISWQSLCNQNKIILSYKKINKPLIIYFRHDHQETTPSNLESLKNKTKAITLKYKENENASKYILAINYWETGNFYTLLNNLQRGQSYFKESLKIQFNFKAFILLFISFLGARTYKKATIILKYVREKIIYKIKLYKNILRYQTLYKQAKQYADNINSSFFKFN